MAPAESTSEDACEHASSRVVFEIPIATYVGFGLLALGGGLLGAIILWHTPQSVIISAILMVVGGMIMLSELNVDDRVFFGYSPADAIVLAIRMVRQWCVNWSGVAAQWGVLAMLPDLQAKDVEDVLRSERLGSDAASSPAMFDVAVNWLQRPQLSLGFEEQIYLHSLYMQAQHGDATDALPVEKTSALGTLDRAVQEGWSALKGKSSDVARERLPQALAELDTGFAVAHPSAAKQPAKAEAFPAPLVQVAMRRMPEDYETRVRSVQGGLATGAGGVAGLLALWALWRRRQARRGIWTAVLAALCGTTAAQLGIAACGLPAWLLASTALVRGGLGDAIAARASAQPGTLDLKTFLWRLLQQLFMPRVATPLFAAETAAVLDMPHAAAHKAAQRRQSL